ncbi:cyclopentanone 1,2-monooxygenase [Durotheca rogersii]|uniref:cyclopentanone 1,2-monooxygenase n=1 Tax=Durotheca rogersii TaxID=419775 RepID=UPI00221F49AC|nr:cyclopentanone 1,2-monooxygenase [Durotheca rogersii]KAI5858258.1 cyclopentanone 1,2-monooxygenase [Durotheca rogersii]
MGSRTYAQELDALIIGAGFSGVYQLKRLRDEGYSAKIVEAGDNYGGVWYWNRYPGARVDSHAPHYQFSDPELWKDFHWSQRFPDHVELRRYFEHVAEKWDLRKDTYFNTFVTSAVWDEAAQKWIVTAKDGRVFRATFFLPHTGIAASRAFPDWKGRDRFRGVQLHSSFWPHAEPDWKGKRIAVIGTGSTGVQMSHALSEGAGELVVFQRTPALPLRMRQVDYGAGEEPVAKEELGDFFRRRGEGPWGFDFGLLPRRTFDDDGAARRATLEALWRAGDFTYWIGNYSDTLFDLAANREVYDFWRDKTRARLHDERLRRLLAPQDPPYPFGCKRVPLEQGYFEMFNQPNVHLVDVNETPVVEITEAGIRTTEKEWEFDIIILATGFDAVTGGLTQIDIRGVGGETVREKFARDGPTTYYGLSVAGFPNMFFSYGPQSPSAFCNGPTCAELQGEWIVGIINHVRDAGLASVVPDEASERAWAAQVNAIAESTLIPRAKSWYMGDGIPGKRRASLMFLGGLTNYMTELKSCAAEGYTGFRFEIPKVQTASA